MKRIRRIQQLGIHNNSRVLLFTAHPDDESTFLGGFMQKCLSARANVKVVCLTDGAKSTLRFGLKTYESLAEVRRKELIRSLHILGVRDIVHAQFQDGECKQRAKTIYGFMHDVADQFQPSVIVSLEPNGIYGHPDHIEISKLSNRLAKAMGTDMLFATVDAHYPSGEDLVQFVGKRVTPTSPSVSIVLSPLQSIRKVRAIQAHRSQFQVGAKSHGPGWRALYTIIHKEFLVIAPTQQPKATRVIQPK